MNAYGYAFPQPMVDRGGQTIPVGDHHSDYGGLCNRDHIALQIMCAAVANPGTTCPWGDDFLARESYKLADMFIAQSNKT